MLSVFPFYALKIELVGNYFDAEPKSAPTRNKRFFGFTHGTLLLSHEVFTKAYHPVFTCLEATCIPREPILRHT